MRYLLALLAFVLWPAAASAAWHEASSEHFVVYADQSERNIVLFSQQLERYHRALEIVTGFRIPPPSPSSRVTVYVVDNTDEIGELYGEGGDDIAGFYRPIASGSVAFVPRVRAAGRETDFSMSVLLHEYAHHFALFNSSFPVPRWLAEGSAEFFAAAQFRDDGNVRLGRIDGSNMAQLTYGRPITGEEVLVPGEKAPDIHSFYAQSWLLYHYLTMEPSRKGQLLEYITALAAGKDLREAAEQAFGDLAQLDKDLRSYRGRRQLMYYDVSLNIDAIGAVSVRRVSEGEAAIMPARIRSKRGVNEERAAEVVAEVRTIAARYSGDAAVLSALAEAEFDSGNDAAAIAAADAALAIDPRQVNAYVQKGYALFRRAEDSDDPHAAYEDALAPFVALNRIENDHPLPLWYYYQSFLDRNAEPPELAVQGLRRAVQLAPFDRGLRMNLAMQNLRDGNMQEARANLIPVAYNPHGGGFAMRVQALIGRIDSGEKLDAFQANLLLSSPEAGDLPVEGEEGDEE